MTHKFFSRSMLGNAATRHMGDTQAKETMYVCLAREAADVLHTLRISENEHSHP